MDIHKPKPWHGWPEFVKEIGTIVIGVLIALAAEAVVEKLHEKRLSAEAREAVRDEINVDLTNMARRYAFETCVVQRLDDLSALLDRAEAGGFSPVEAVHRPLAPYLFTQRWTAATAGGRTSLLSSEQQRAYGRVYEIIDLLRQDEAEELKAWIDLQALNGLRHLSPQTIDDQRRAVARAREWRGIVQQDFGEAKTYAAQLGIKGDARLLVAAEPRTIRPHICEPLSGAPADRN